MKIAVVCANGKEGRLIVKEAIARGFDVTAFIRGENKSEAKKFVSKDAFALNAADFADFDVVVDAFGAWTAETIPGIAKEMKVLGAALDGTKKTPCSCRRSRKPFCKQRAHAHSCRRCRFP